MGVLIEVNCETDFVARTDDFKTLVKDLALHVCAMNPPYVRREEVPGDVLEKELAHFTAEAKAQGKPENVIEKIAQGKLEKRYSELCLLDQPFVKDPSRPISEYIKSYIAKLGENVVVRRFVRFELGK
jgi:elongation factor Ts